MNSRLNVSNQCTIFLREIGLIPEVRPLKRSGNFDNVNVNAIMSLFYEIVSSRKLGQKIVITVSICGRKIYNLM